MGSEKMINPADKDGDKLNLLCNLFEEDAALLVQAEKMAPDHVSPHLTELTTKMR